MPHFLAFCALSYLAPSRILPSLTSRGLSLPAHSFMLCCGFSLILISFQIRIKSRNQFGFSPEAIYGITEQTNDKSHDTYYQDEPFQKDDLNIINSEPLPKTQDLSDSTITSGTTELICTYLIIASAVLTLYNL